MPKLTIIFEFTAEIPSAEHAEHDAEELFHVFSPATEYGWYVADKDGQVLKSSFAVTPQYFLDLAELAVNDWPPIQEEIKEV